MTYSLIAIFSVIMAGEVAYFVRASWRGEAKGWTMVQIALSFCVIVSLALSSCSTGPSPVADAPVDIPAASIQPAMNPVSEAPACPAGNAPPCVVDVISFDNPAQIGYRLCCPVLRFAISALAVDSVVGPWGDVTTWSLCGHGYVVEVTHPQRAGSLPWAVLDTYDGNGGPISECKTALAP